MKFFHRVLITVLLFVAFAAALVVLISGFSAVLPLSVAVIILSAAWLMGINWVWADYHRKQK